MGLGARRRRLDETPVEGAGVVPIEIPDGGAPAVEHADDREGHEGGAVREARQRERHTEGEAQAGEVGEALGEGRPDGEEDVRGGRERDRPQGDRKARGPHANEGDESRDREDDPAPGAGVVETHDEADLPVRVVRRQRERHERLLQVEHLDPEGRQDAPGGVDERHRVVDGRDEGRTEGNGGARQEGCDHDECRRDGDDPAFARTQDDPGRRDPIEEDREAGERRGALLGENGCREEPQGEGPSPTPVGEHRPEPEDGGEKLCRTDDGGGGLRVDRQESEEKRRDEGRPGPDAAVSKEPVDEDDDRGSQRERQGVEEDRPPSSKRPERHPDGLGERPVESQAQPVGPVPTRPDVRDPAPGVEARVLDDQGEVVENEPAGECARGSAAGTRRAEAASRCDP